MNWLCYGCAISAVAAAATSGGPSAALAQDYPTRPIRLVIVTAASGLMDVAARVIGGLKRSHGCPSVCASSRSRARFILKLETDLLQAFHSSLAVLLLNLFGQARCIGDGVNLLVGFRYDHDQQAT